MGIYIYLDAHYAIGLTLKSQGDQLTLPKVIGYHAVNKGVTVLPQTHDVVVQVPRNAAAMLTEPLLTNRGSS